MTGSGRRARRLLGQALGAFVAPAVAFLGARLRTRGAVVLTYHDVTGDPRNPTDQVTPGDLRAQLAAARRWGMRFVGLRELTDRLLRGDPIDGLAAVVFDDALVGVHHDGVPLLRELGVPATVFVVSSRLGTAEPPWWPGSDRMMNRAELLETAAAGLEIGSHTRTHPDLPALGPSELADELAGSRTELEDLVGRPVDLLAYPSGHYDRAVLDTTAAAGYRAAFTFRPGRLEPGLDPYRLPRLPMWSRHQRLRLAYNLARPQSSFPEHQLDAVGHLDAVGPG